MVADGAPITTSQSTAKITSSTTQTARTSATGQHSGPLAVGATTGSTTRSIAVAHLTRTGPPQISTAARLAETPWLHGRQTHGRQTHGRVRVNLVAGHRRARWTG